MIIYFRKLLIITLCLLFLVSCETSTTTVNEQNVEEVTIQELQQKYSAQILVTSDKYTIELQNLLKTNSQPFVFSANVSDLYEIDNKIYIKLDHVFNYFILECPEDIANSIITKRQNDNMFSYADLFFVANLEDVKKMDFYLDSYMEDENYISTEIDTADTLIFRGKLLGYKEINK